jgi:solute carrier family 8 (sodium/calcium exchanger)
MQGYGLSLENDMLMGAVYFFLLCYMFVGIAIVSDIFMESIETITEQTRIKTYIDNFGKEQEYEQTVWNPTVANLTLMALGSSAPEILLSVYETIVTIDSTPGELGPSTIVGSAAFNLMIISAVSVMAVDEVKKIDDLGVFAVTSIASLFAYIWIYITLQVWTPGVVSVVEAFLTLFYFFLLIGGAYAADRCRNAGLEKEKSEEEKEELEREKMRLVSKAYLRKMAQQHGQQFVIECVTGGTYAANATDE